MTKIGDVHPDDAAVDRFAAAMKEKLAAARAKGRGGWNSDEPGMQQRLSDMLRAHVEKGDPRDVANFCMFLHQRGESIMPQQQQGQPAAVDRPELVAAALAACDAVDDLIEKWYATRESGCLPNQVVRARGASNLLRLMLQESTQNQEPTT